MLQALHMAVATPRFDASERRKKPPPKGGFIATRATPTLLGNRRALVACCICNAMLEAKARTTRSKAVSRCGAKARVRVNGQF